MAATTRLGETRLARERILQTAFRLFYARGVRGVGVDTVIAESGVAKATLYEPRSRRAATTSMTRSTPPTGPKYGRYSSYVEAMVAPQAPATTLKLVPRADGGGAA